MGVLKVNKLLQDTATSGNGSAHNLKGESHEVTFYIVPSGTISAGAITLETADDPDYSGTWSKLADAITIVESTQIHRTFTGALKAVRARISTTVTGGGSVTVRLVGK